MTSRWIPVFRWVRAALVAAALLASWSAPSLAQPLTDRADPSMAIEEEAEEQDQAPRLAEHFPRVDPVGGNDVMTATRPFVAGAIRIDGATALPPAAFAAAIEPYLGRPLSEADLRALARDVADVARRAGYGLATAWVPPQNVTNGVLRVRIDEGRIDAIEASGPAGPAVERLLRRLAGGAPVRLAQLERQLLLAEDLAGVTLGQARLVRSGTRNVLRVETALESAVARVLADNWGTSAIGPIKVRLSADFNGLATTGDSLYVAGVTTPLQPREFQLVQAAYSLPLGGGGTEATVRGYLSRSSAGGSLRDRDLDGDSREIELGLSHPLRRSRAQSLWGHVFFGLRDNELDRAGVETRDDRIVALSGTLYGTMRTESGAARVRLSLVQGLDVLDATRRGDPLASRIDAGGAFTKLTFWADYVRRFGRQLSFQLAGEGQLASRPLLATEEMGLGGRSFLRGYDYREFAGDRGAAASAELRFDLRNVARPVRRAQVYAYADAGRVTNLGGGVGGGSLASAGGGLRLAFDHRLDAGLELGVPLADGFSGTRPDPRLSFTLGARF